MSRVLIGISICLTWVDIYCPVRNTTQSIVYQVRGFQNKFCLRSIVLRCSLLTDSALGRRALSVQKDPQVMDNLAVFYIHAGRADQAHELYKQLHQLFPEHIDSKVHHVSERDDEPSRLP